MSTVYKKSLKGVEEVALRSNGLQLRLRAYLILVDGTQSVVDIQQANPGLPEVEMVLAALLDEGYLEAIGQRSVAASNAQTNAAAPQPPNNTAAPQRQAHFPATTNNSLDSSQFLQARENMVREIMSLLGKDAEMVVTKIQRCDNAMDLFAMMMGLKKIITMYVNADKAEQFSNKFSYISMF